MAELVTMRSRDVDLGPAYVGEAELRLFEAPGEELATLEPREMIAGYWRQVGATFDGGTRLGVDAARSVPSRRSDRDRGRRARLRRDPGPAGHVLRGSPPDRRDDPARRRPSPRAGPALQARLRREELRRPRCRVRHRRARGAAPVPEALDGRDRAQRPDPAAPDQPADRLRGRARRRDRPARPRSTGRGRVPGTSSATPAATTSRCGTSRRTTISGLAPKGSTAPHRSVRGSRPTSIRTTPWSGRG